MKGWVLLASLAGAAPLAAQDEVAVTARTRLLDRAWGWSGPAVWFGGQVRLERPSWLLDVSASGAPATHGSWSGETFGSVRWQQRISRSLGAFVEGRGAAERRLHGGVDGEGRSMLGVRAERGAFRLGAGVAAYLGSPGATAGGIATARLDLGRLRLSGELGRFDGFRSSRDGSASVPVQDTLMAPEPPGTRRNPLSHLLLNGRFSIGVFEVSGRLIRRSPLVESAVGAAAAGRNAWQVGAIVEPWAGVRVHLSAGRAPVGPSVYLPFARQLSLGLALVDRPRRASSRDTGAVLPALDRGFEVEAEGNGQIVRVRHPRARRVELVGDFSGWQPVSMARRGDHWEARLRLASGVYLINLRIDGAALEVPVGLPATEDSFGGRAGILIVP